MTKLTVTIGAQDYVITPASATSTLYAASKAGVSFDAAKYYQSTVKMGKVIEVLYPGSFYNFVGPTPQIHYLHIGLDQAYAIAKQLSTQLSTQNGGATVAVIYNHNGTEATYALSTDGSATQHTGEGIPNDYRVFLATLWESAQ